MTISNGVPGTEFFSIATPGRMGYLESNRGKA